MSNFNTTDIIEDDAADLKFPKDNSSCDSFSDQDIDKDNNITIVNHEIFTPDPVCCSCKIILIEPFIKCAICDNINICCLCFSNGFENNKHKNNHDYTIVRYNFPIINNDDDDDNWTANEELLLLNVLQECGFGNWKDIERRIQNKTAEQCQRHYMKYYVDNQYLKGLPVMRESESTIFGSKPIPYFFKLQDLDDPPRFQSNSINSRHFAGYNSARSDFETNFDNHAELLISELKYNEFNNNNDDDNDINNENDDNYKLFQCLQANIVDAYNNRLKERQRRKKIIRKHGLIAVRRTYSWLRRYDSTITSPIVERLVSFMQLVDGIEFDYIMEGLHRAGELRNYLTKLFEFRSNGLRHKQSVKMFNKLSKIKIEKDKERRIYLNQSSFTIKHIDTTNNGDGNGNRNTEIVSHNCFTQRRPPPPLEIRRHIGYDKLTSPEKDLCSNARILPEDFLYYKNMLIIENKKLGSLKLSQARPLLRIDVNKTRKIYDFFVQEGHINQPNN
ncbi:transcriptional adapter 2-alpha-like isoform X1 [Aphidius gifuensis]|uniref:transcriptional adapter 2-alpha-like isoform X1 n=1 Tax=Aphidius gifuensis TaxID=684658 RepID=UPI001CDD71E2|nr:transcriptional adapter 2-alpha-like isoform X1 [Aphidius gifuensis]